VLLIAALLAGWQAALVHPLEHFDDQGGFVHVADGHSGNPNSHPSGLCDVLAALTACASHAPISLAHSTSVQPLPVFAGSELRTAQAPPFLSQGPPALL
jgi:hypothetical protein